MPLARSYKPPLTLRAYDALPGHPFWIGIAFTVALIVVFFAGRMIVDGASDSTPDDLRIAITQILMATYSASAYAYLLTSARRTTQDLSSVAPELPQWRAAVDLAGKHPWWILALVGTASILLVGVPATNATTPAPVNPWEWRAWNYDVFWHRVTSVFFVWWIGCFCYVVVVESARLSRLSKDIESVDLLDMTPYRPLMRQGLTNALLVVGMASVLSLLAVEARYVPMLALFWIEFVVLAWIGMMLPLRGIRRKIRAAKERELDWCRRKLRTSRDGLKSGSDEGRSIAEILAYKGMIEDLRNWPFDSPTLVRFSLYLLIPLGSWLGGAFVERGLDLVLS
ncbi:MAG: hypothetical protein QNJ07_13460 [Woeseiaceae bacterium]|nr:hypothetical protein [Woeseiaceae bacterium]